MDIITLDFETYYDKDFSLRKMQTDAYIADPRFEVLMVGICTNDGPVTIIEGTEVEIAAQLVGYDWKNSAVRCHNTLFDGFILAHVYGIKPKLWMDTLSQGRMIYPWLRSHSLANMAKHHELPDKGTAVTNATGKRRRDFTTTQWAEYKEYCAHDVALCRAMGVVMDKRTMPIQFAEIDMTIRMFTEPKLIGDVGMMEKLYADEVRRKEELLAKAAVDKSIIMSGDKLAEALLALGVVAPTKVSPRTGKTAYAFAKTDKGFQALLEHPDPDVQALVAARLGVKSTIAETRAKRFLEMSKRGKLSVYLNFWGAKTTGRYSGGDKCLSGDSWVTVLREGEVLVILLSAVQATDHVWDGEMFVPHEGVVCNGLMEVIEYDGVIGTADHKVYVRHREEPVELAVAACEGLVLRSGNTPRGMGEATQKLSGG